MTSKLPRGLIGWAIAASVGTFMALALQLWIWIVLALRPVSHGSGDYLVYQYAALVLGTLPSLIALGVVIRFMLRHGRRRSSVWLLVADIVCLILVGVLIVPPALTVFRFAPTDDAVFHERARLGYFAHGDPGSEFRPDDAQYALQQRVDAVAHDLGFEDDDIPYVKAPGDATHHARPGTSPAGNPLYDLLRVLRLALVRRPGPRSGRGVSDMDEAVDCWRGRLRRGAEGARPHLERRWVHQVHAGEPDLRHSNGVLDR